jgi:hypothetical protein
MRLAGKLRCGFYPLPLPEAEAIRSCLEFPLTDFSALDPCIGDGEAFARITADTKGVAMGSSSTPTGRSKRAVWLIVSFKEAASMSTVPWMPSHCST